MVTARQYQVPRVATGALRIRVGAVRRRLREMEGEAFDPSPPPRGTVLLTRFGFASDQLSAQHRATINRVAAGIIALRPPALHCVFVDVEGHEDEVGDPARFGVFGARRAAAAIRALEARLRALAGRIPAGVTLDVRITPSSTGPARPIRSNVTPDGRAQNRRVEIRTRVAPCGVIA
jgi:outer membrane protein OmpA-like peptidoglycan-associated protein